MEKIHETWIKELEYDQLSAAQKEALHDFCENEEAFLQLKYIFKNLAQQQVSFSVDAKVKRNLDDLFKQQHAVQNQLWLNKMWLVLNPEEKAVFKRPVFQLAAASALIIGYFTLFHQPVNGHADLVAKKEVKRDQKDKPSNTMEQSSKAPLLAKLDHPAEQSLNSADASLNQSQSEPLLLNQIPAKSLEDKDANLMYGAISKAEDMSVASNLEEEAVSHPDGIYQDLAPVKYEYAMDEIPEMLDLLAAAF